MMIAERAYHHYLTSALGCSGLILALIAAVLAFAPIGREGGEAARTIDRLTRELDLVTDRIDRLSTSIDNGDIEGRFSPSGAAVQVLLDRRAGLARQLGALRSRE